MTASLSRPGRSRLVGLAAGLAVLSGGLLLWQGALPGSPPPSPSAAGDAVEASERRPDRAPAPTEIATVLDVLFKDAPQPAAAPPEPAAGTAETRSRRDPADPEHGREIQRRLSILGHFRGEATGVWGPESRQALRRFKAAHRLAADDVWDEPTELALFDPALVESADFVGLWAPQASACSPRSNRTRLLPAVINHQGAWAGPVSCAFRDSRRLDNAWHFTATCSGTRRRWTSNVSLGVSGDTLTWTSERGSRTYVRCPAPA
jgi:hypothetical protein